MKGNQKPESAECSSPDGRYLVLHKNGGLWVQDNESGETRMVEAEGQYSAQCFSPEGKFAYSTGESVRVFELANKKSTEVGRGAFPTWSRDGKWLGFDDGKHYILLNPTTGIRRRLFSTKGTGGPLWSPDSRFLTYTSPGGSMGGFLFWGIKCIEPYKVWVWRVKDGAHDWVDQVCKPGFPLSWVNNSELGTP